MSKQSVKQKSRPRGASDPADRARGDGMRRGQAAGASERSKRPSGVMSKASGIAYGAADTVMQAASDGASGISRQVTDVLDRQVSGGADVISQVASSTRLAADDLDDKAPQIAEMVRNVADRIDGYADGLRGKSVDEIIGTASDFARRQPAAVFGLSAMLGFLVFRSLKNASGGQSSRPAATEDLSTRTRRHAA